MVEENSTDPVKDEELDKEDNDVDNDDSEEEEEDLDNEDSEDEDDWDSDYDEDDEGDADTDGEANGDVESKNDGSSEDNTKIDKDESANENNKKVNDASSADDIVDKVEQEKDGSVDENQGKKNEKPLSPVVDIGKTKKPAILDIGAVEGLPVELTFETSRKQVSLGELISVTEGYIFVSQNPVSNPLEIRANGKLIGHGRLVNVEGNIGVQITELV